MSELIAECDERDAVLSADAVYRYWLHRRWNSNPLLYWVMLNPSTADALKDDPTIRKCIESEGGR